MPVQSLSSCVLLMRIMRRTPSFFSFCVDSKRGAPLSTRCQLLTLPAVCARDALGEYAFLRGRMPALPRFCSVGNTLLSSDTVRRRAELDGSAVRRDKPASMVVGGEKQAA
jgi:hypothetical protein